MIFGSLFSGIGGLDLALEAFGHTPVWQAEIDPFARDVLAKHWPKVRCYADVKEIDGRAERPDIICGGFPCQDISDAGLREGIDGERSGLWSEFVRIIRVLRPRVVFVENVAALLHRGMGRVLGDLASLGFDAEWAVFGAWETGTHFEGERLYLLATSNEVDEPTWLEFHGQYGGPLFGTGKGGGFDIRTPPAALAHRETDGVRRRLGIAALGNAVVPQQAALAWETLTGRVS